MNEKQQFFDQLHTKLAKKYKVSPGIINFVRSEMRKGMTIHEVSLIARSRIEQKMNAIAKLTREHLKSSKNLEIDYKNTLTKIRKYKMLIKAIPEWDAESLKDITQQTKYDKAATE